MYKRRYLILPLLFVLSTVLWARDKAPQWTELRSPHFTVLTDSSEKQARQVADQFERMRDVFHTAFPRMHVDPSAPIVILAVKDEKGFRALEPPSYLAKGQLQLAGYFLQAPEKNYILLRLDPGGDHPYSTVYHEYTHLISHGAAESLPVWVDEGLAEFYQNTDIRDKDVMLGEPSPGDLILLQQNRMLPLGTLFTVDHNSPYYHEENRGSIFYAEAWALTHFLMFKDRQDNTTRLRDYLSLMAQNIDSVTAATRAFGDLDQLQEALQAYVRQSRYLYFKMAASTGVDESTFKVVDLTPAQADAVRADLLVYNDRTLEAKSLLEDVLRDDPNNASAHESMGYLEFREGHTDEARKWYEQAVKLDSQSYLAHYYFATMSMEGNPDAETSARVESSLRAAIKLNPAFAPAYDRLAVYYAMRRQNLDEAHMLTVQAVQYDPGNFNYRINSANILLAMGRANDAITVSRNAMKLAKSPAELKTAVNLIEMAGKFAEARKQADEMNARLAKESVDSSKIVGPISQPEADDSTPPPPPLRHRDEASLGPRRVVEGKVVEVTCTTPASMDLQIEAGKQPLALHTDNYFAVPYTATNFTPEGELHPCTDLKGMRVRATYQAVSPSGGHLVSVEISK